MTIIKEIYRDLPNGEVQEIQARCVYGFEDCPGSYLHGRYLQNVHSAWDIMTDKDVTLTDDEMELLY